MIPSSEESAASPNVAAMIGIPIITVLPYEALSPIIAARANPAPSTNRAITIATA